MRRLLAGTALSISLAGYLTLRELPLPQANGAPYQKLPQTPYEQHPNRHFLTKLPSTIGVIGGGSAGLVTAKVLSQQGFTVEVLERSDAVGGVWAENYDHCGLQFPYTHYNMPDHAFPAGTPVLPRLPAVRSFLDSYIEKFALRPLISLRSEVISVNQTDAGGWVVGLKSGVEKRYDFLVLATGHCSNPYIPPFPGLDTFTGTAIHSCEFRGAQAIAAGKRVVVVGGSKSAYDMMTLASDSGATVTGVMNTRFWTIPLGATLFGCAIETLLTNRVLEATHFSPDEPATWKTAVLRPFAAWYWKLVTDKMREGVPAAISPQVDYSEQRYSLIIARDPNIVSKVRAGEIEIVTGRVDRIVPEGLVCGERLIPADVIVFATGFKVDKLGIWDGDMWMYRGCIFPSTKNFAAIGFGTSFFTQLKNNLQAVWLAEVLRGTVRLPATQSMHEEVNTRKSAMLSALSDFKPRAAFVRHELQYYDSLIRDMGLQVRRKRSIAADWLEAPDPLEYRTVVTHRV